MIKPIEELKRNGILEVGHPQEKKYAVKFQGVGTLSIVKDTFTILERPGIAKLLRGRLIGGGSECFLFLKVGIARSP